jgi:hypothetical protein
MDYSALMADARLRKATIQQNEKEFRLRKQALKQERKANNTRKAMLKLAKRNKLLAQKLNNKHRQTHPLLVLPPKRAQVLKEYAYILSGLETTKNLTMWTSCTKPTSGLHFPHIPIFVLAKVEEFKDDPNVEFQRQHNSIAKDEYVLLGLAFESASYKRGVETFDTELEFGKMVKTMHSQVGTRGENGLNHFGSSARGVFSFGKSAKYTLDPVTQSSVSDFSFKVGISPELEVSAKEKAMSYLGRTLQYLAKEIHAYLSIDGINLTNTLLKGLNKRAASTPLKDFLGTSLQGYAAGHFNFEYNCKVVHSERDSTYTLLHIPLQTAQDEDRHGMWFEWSTTERGKDPGVVIFFSAYGLSHRQQHLAGSLMNLSFYASKCWEIINSTVLRSPTVFLG